MLEPNGIIRTKWAQAKWRPTLAAENETDVKKDERRSACRNWRRTARGTAFLSSSSPDDGASPEGRIAAEYA